MVRHVEEGKQRDSGDYEVMHDATMGIASKTSEQK